MQANEIDSVIPVISPENSSADSLCRIKGNHALEGKNSVNPANPKNSN